MDILLIIFIFFVLTALFSINQKNYLYLMCFILPFHTLILSLLYKFHLPISYIRVISSWKEIAIISMLLVIFTFTITKVVLSRETISIKFVDLPVYLFFTLSIVYLVFPLDRNQPLLLRIVGFRSTVFFVFSYIIGKNIRLNEIQLMRILKRVSIFGFFVATWGLFEYLFLPYSFYTSVLGVEAFQEEYLGIHTGQYGVPVNWHTSVGQFRRAVSFFLGPHGHAGFYLISIIIAIVFLKYKIIKNNFFRTANIIIQFLVFLLAFTRSTWIAIITQITIIGKTERSRKILSIGLLAALGIILIVVFSYNFEDSYSNKIFVLNEGSSFGSHIIGWGLAFYQNLSRPLGHGLGTSGHIYSRYKGSWDSGSLVSAGEGEFFSVWHELGIIGLFVYLLMLWMFIVQLKKIRRMNSDYIKPIATISILVFIGVMIMGIFTVPRNIPFVWNLCWFLLGYTSRFLKPFTKFGL